MSGAVSAHASAAEDSTATALAAVTVQTQGMAAVMVPAGEAIPATAQAASLGIQDMAHHQVLLALPALEITAALPLLPTKGTPATAPGQDFRRHPQDRLFLP